MTESRVHGLTIERRCPVCSSGNSRLQWAKGTLHVVRCTDCGMCFANPVEGHYADGAFYNQVAGSYQLSTEKVQSDFAPVRFARERRTFHRYCHSGSVLDVGCSTGGFLASLETHYPGDYELLGTDVAEQSLDHAERQRIPICRGSFLDADFGGKRFAAITFWAVLEHLAEPQSFLRKAATLLEPGGHVFVLVPNMKSLAVRTLGPRYRYIMPEHLNYFTPASLIRLVARAPDLEVVELSTSHFNPVVLWQDWRHPVDRVPDRVRATLLQRTTRWKEDPRWRPARWIYSAVEGCLGKMGLADNIVVVLHRRHSAG